MENKTIYLDDMNVVMDYMWCYNNIDWDGCNSSGTTTFVADKNLKWFYVDGENIETFNYNKIVCMSGHGFCGTTFYFSFYLDDVFITSLDSGKFAPNIETLIKLQIDEIDLDNKRLMEQYKNNELKKEKLLNYEK